MRAFALMVALGLAACGGNGDDDVDLTYRVDGIAIVLEDGVGPEDHEMVLAAELFRREAETLWTLGIGAEGALWGCIGEIRWTDEFVPLGGSYRGGNLRIEWTGCAITGQLYRLLTEHYRGVDMTDRDLDAMRELAERNTFICQG